MPRALIFVLLLAGGNCLIAGEARPVSLTLDYARAFPFPRLVLGAQEEVVVMPYLAPEYWQQSTDTGVALLRYPCGTPSDWFCWDQPDNGYWPEYFQKRKKNYPDDFANLCRQQGFAPLITVNTSSYGAPVETKRINPLRPEDIKLGAEYAARWVEDFNRKKSFGVKYWEIGNEVWIWLFAKEYAEYVKAYAQAMRQIDPDIKLIACGLAEDSPNYRPTWLNFPQDPNWRPRPFVQNFEFEWTEGLLRDAAGAFDYLAPHIYPSGRSADPLENGRELFGKIHDNLTLRKQIRHIQDAHSPVRLAVTEWMINFTWDPAHKTHFIGLGQKDKADLTYENSPTFMFISALLAADFIGKMASSGYVDLAVAHTVTGGLIRQWNHQTSQAPATPPLMPAGVALKFWKRFAGEEVVPLEVDADCPFFSAGHLHTPYVSAYVTRAPGRLNLILINRSPDQAFPVALPAQIEGRPVTAAQEHAVSAPGWGSSMWPAMADPQANPFTETSRELPLGELGAFELRPSRLTAIELSF